MEVADINSSSSKHIIGSLPMPFHYYGSVLSVASNVDSLSPELLREGDNYDNELSDDEDDDDDVEKDKEDEEEGEHLATPDPSVVPTDDPVPSS
ncbi:hypothetical protein Tco_0319691 [Tanacetum coccineum]